jgi:hypothetical protein
VRVVLRRSPRQRERRGHSAFARTPNGQTSAGRRPAPRLPRRPSRHHRFVMTSPRSRERGWRAAQSHATVGRPGPLKPWARGGARRSPGGRDAPARRPRCGTGRPPALAASARTPRTLGVRPHAERPNERRTTTRTASTQASGPTEPTVTDGIAPTCRAPRTIVGAGRRQRELEHGRSGVLHAEFVAGGLRRCVAVVRATGPRRSGTRGVRRCGCAFSARLAVRVQASGRRRRTFALTCERRTHIRTALWRPRPTAATRARNGIRRVRSDVRMRKESARSRGIRPLRSYASSRAGTWRRIAASAAQHTSMATAMTAKNERAPRYSSAQAPT